MQLQEWQFPFVAMGSACELRLYAAEATEAERVSALAQAEVARLKGEITSLEGRIEDLVGEKARLVKDKSALKASIEETEEALADLAARKAAAEPHLYLRLLGD